MHARTHTCVRAESSSWSYSRPFLKICRRWDLEGGGTHGGETRLEHQPRSVAKGLLAVKMGEVWQGVSFRGTAVCMHHRRGQARGHIVLYYNHVI